MDTIAYLDAVKTRHNWDSDYKLAKELGVSKGRISNYRTGRQGMDDELCLVVAKLLDVDPSTVLIDIFSERTKSSKAAKILRETAKQLGSAAASLFVTLTMLYMSTASTDAIASPTGASVLQCILCKISQFLYSINENYSIVFFTLFLSNQLIFRCLLQLRNIKKRR